jgi:hypothetical protein
MPDEEMKNVESNRSSRNNFEVVGFTLVERATIENCNYKNGPER